MCTVVVPVDLYTYTSIHPPPLSWFIIIQNKDLVTAAKSGDVQSVQRLIVGGANVNCKDEVI